MQEAAAHAKPGDGPPTKTVPVITKSSEQELSETTPLKSDEEK